jgi:serine/threonine-protein kinase HipA
MKIGVPSDDLLTHFDHVAYSWIIGNGDLHAKNIAVLHLVRPGRLGSPPSPTGVRYAPLYDLVCTKLVLSGDDFALTLNGKRNKIRIADFRSLGQRIGMSRSGVSSRLEDLARRVRGHIAETVRVSEMTRELQDRLLGIVERNIQTTLG